MAYLKAADGRDLSKEEWRVIPSFPSYKITKDGDVRNINSGELLVERETAQGTYYYNLSKQRPNGRWHGAKRQYLGLVKEAFPELYPEQPKRDYYKPKHGGPKRSYILHGEWRTIPGYPNLELHETGGIRFAHSRKRFKFKVDHEGREFVNLTNSNGHLHWLKDNLIAFVFPEKGVTFIPDSTDDPNWKIHPTYSAYEVNYEGQVRHRVRKQNLIPNRYNLYVIRVSGHRYYWRRDRFFTNEEWDAFWNETFERDEAA